MENNTLDIFSILKMLGHHIKMIIVFMLAGAILSGAVSFLLISPKYASQSEVIVSLPQSNVQGLDNNEVTATLQMLSTYKDLILSDTVVNGVKEKIAQDSHIHLSAEEIRNSLSIVQNQNSQMFSITAQASTPAVAQEITNTTADVFNERVADIINVDKITILSRASLNRQPVSPNHKLFILAGLAGGLILSLLIILLMEMRDTTIKSKDYLTNKLNLLVLGEVSPFTNSDIRLDEQRRLVRKGD